jgi:hypothetical protein
MKMTNKMIGSRMTQTALLLGALLCAQNLMACYVTLPEPCSDGLVSGNCSGESPTGFVYAQITGASSHDVCATASNSQNPSGSYTCDTTSIPCTATLVVFACDGSETDTPLTGTTTEATLGPIPCSSI